MKVPIDPMHDHWLLRWEEGRIGWHQPGGCASLRRHWRARGRRVLVPLCGKTLDLRWLAERGHEVVGIELSEHAIRAFFAEQDLDRTRRDGPLPVFASTALPITIHCGDYFALTTLQCDAHFDRGALVAMPADVRPGYAAHTDSLLRADVERLVVTLDYDQAVVDGPPFAVPAAEVRGYWPDLTPIEERDVIREVPPRFREAGLGAVTETIWRSP